MSIANEISKLQTNLKDCFDTCADNGAYLPEDINFDNLAACIETIKNPFNKPSDWSDIRTDCPENSIALYAAHSADYSSYDNLGFTATCTGGYNVFIDGTQYGTTYASGAQCSITWSASGITTGDDITTPEALKAHKIWIEPATAGNNITAFRCNRVAASGTEYQGILWAHFNIENAINLNKAFGSLSPVEHLNQIMMSCTAKDNILRVITNIQQCFRNCQSLEYIPVIQGNNASLGCNYAFSNCYKLNNVTIKNIKARYATCILQSCRAVKKVIFNNCDFSALDVVTEFISQAAQLSNLSLDFSNSNSMKILGCIGTSEYFMGGFKGLRVSNEAPFDYATAPQINVGYTGLNRTALVQLFNDLPYNVGYTVVGSPTITDGVVSGFSNSNYLSLPTSLNLNQDFEISIQFKFTSEITDSYYNLLSFNMGGAHTLQIIRWAANQAFLRANSPFNATSGNFQVQEINDWQENAIYKIVWKRVGETGYLDLFRDGNLISSATKEYTTSQNAISEFIIGARVATYANAFSVGEIDLNNFYIKTNGVTWFGGKPARANKPEITITGCTGTADLTTADKQIAEIDKLWKVNY